MAEPWFWGESHVSWEIVGTEKSDIAGKCIVVGVTGSVAAYRAVDVVRKLMRFGARVRVVMSREAAKFITPLTMEWASGYPVVVDASGQTEHVALADKCDALAIVPATLKTLADIAAVRADTAVTALAQEMLGRGKPVLAVPVMHGGMWNRFREKILPELEKDGVYLLEPIIDEGRAKLPNTETIAWWIEATVTRKQDLKGLRILVTAGPTREHIDPVRVITNPSSGLMGVSIALEAAFRGADVTLVHGPLCVSIDLHPLKRRISVESSDEMWRAVTSELKAENYHAAVYAAAVADYRPERSEKAKIPSTRGELVLKLIPTRKIVADAVAIAPRIIHVAFAAETVSSIEELETRAREKLERYNVDAIVANNVAAPGIGFASEENEVVIITRDGRKWAIPRLPKRMVARRILDAVRSLVAGRH